jgi:hypothetical protein
MTNTNELDDEPTAKDISTLAAKAARAGWELRRVQLVGAAGYWRISRGNSAYVTRCWHSVRSILTRMGGNK